VVYSAKACRAWLWISQPSCRRGGVGVLIEEKCVNRGQRNGYATACRAWLKWLWIAPPSGRRD